MNLDEMLIYADIDQIHKIVDNYQCQCDRHSKTDMIQSIIYTILQKNKLENQISELNNTEYTFIQLLYLDSRNKYTIEDLLAKGKQAIGLTQSSIKARDLVLTALKNGWIFQGVGKKHLLVYLVPEDFKSKVIKIINNRLQERVIFSDEVNYYRDEKGLLISDIIKFLNFIEKEEVLLTGEGNIYKRQQRTLFKQLLVPEEPLKKMAWRFGYGRRYNEYPDRFSLIYDYTFYNKLIYEDEKGLLYLTSFGKKYINNYVLSKEEMAVYQFWIRLYKYSIPFLQLVVRLIDLVATSKWVELDSLEQVVNFWLNDRYYENKQQIFRERIIKMLLHLGVIKIGNQGNKIFIQVSEKGNKLINGFVSFDVKEIVLK
ncbi:hypothetical protein BHF71_10200 [Vulcanibacillus modesticaldus]|uniref:Helicase XPB/Ssl2 N-terminal domain-containing protein n=1 Tax=Vulcanibacillus modesticaldus TaxID=337097 RepID=A0A1D2YTI8_9BACI|nr:hypothetical protein [Vulcanibacillus modesticaldus]OEF99022.1 hypothetical protein BHF71_10200 [Vulcanibacillus modesticaldus]